MLHLITATIMTGKKGDTKKTVVATVNARNGKGAMRIFILGSKAVDEGELVSLTIEAQDDATPRGLVSETVEGPTRKPRGPNKPKAAKAETAATEPPPAE